MKENQITTWYTNALRKLFEHKLMHALKHKSLITDTVIAQIRSWNTSGFSIHDSLEIQRLLNNLGIPKYRTPPTMIDSPQLESAA